MMFFDSLEEKIVAGRTRLCLGIDPQRQPGQPFSAIEGMVRSLAGQAIAHDLPAVKLQSAYFEAFGLDGMKLLQAVIADLKRHGVLVILDAKRGDISSTMKAYGEAAFDWLHADCLTVNPYMGIDTIEPLLPWLRQGKGIYAVWLTSNKSADALQLSASGARPFVAHVYDVIREYAHSQEVSRAVGYVLGATKLSDPRVARLVGGFPAESFLLPGVGAQGAVVDAAMHAFFLKHPASLVPVSREIGGHPFTAFADYDRVAGAAVSRLRAELAVPV
jgi:orotidine 5'-phosphate decarboxylase subfamily 2